MRSLLLALSVALASLTNVEAAATQIQPGITCLVCLDDVMNIAHEIRSPSYIPRVASTGPVHGLYGGRYCTEHGHTFYYCLTASLAPEDRATLESTATPDVPTLRRMLDRYPRVVTLNVERGAIQVWDCEGTGVVAHIPVSRDQIASLAVRVNRQFATRD